MYTSVGQYIIKVAVVVPVVALMPVAGEVVVAVAV